MVNLPHESGDGSLLGRRERAGRKYDAALKFAKDGWEYGNWTGVGYERFVN